MVEGEPAITVAGVRKAFPGGSPGAGLNGVDLTVPAGQVIGILGPNGAGKTTLIRILTTLLRPDAGTVRVAGADAVRDGATVRRRIGLVGQAPAIDEQLTGQQNLELFGRLAGLTNRGARDRAGDLLATVDLATARDQTALTYSGGMRRRLDLAVSLITVPAVLFVDEPTTGLDPAARRTIWRLLRELVAAGTTLCLTTQYLEEADQLADRIVMLRAGRIVAEGTPAALKASLGGAWLEVVLPDAVALARTTALAVEVGAGEPVVAVERLQVRLPVAGDDPAALAALVALAARLGEAGIVPVDFGVRRPSLDDVFLRLTGPEARAAVGGDEDARNQGEVAA